MKNAIVVNAFNEFAYNEGLGGGVVWDKFKWVMRIKLSLIHSKNN